jgi:hypothetical protein
MIRRVVNLVVKNDSTGIHSVHRVDPYKHLFYKSAAEAASSNTNKGVDSTRGMQILALPDPVVSFAPSPTSLPRPYKGDLDFFALLGTCASEGKIVSANMAGETVLYDADERLFLNLPWLSEPKGWNPVCLSISLPGTVENSLYVIDRRPGSAMHRFCNIREEYASSCFEVLEYGSRGVRNMPAGWRWRLLDTPRGTWKSGGMLGSGRFPFMGKLAISLSSTCGLASRQTAIHTCVLWTFLRWSRTNNNDLLCGIFLKI